MKDISFIDEVKDYLKKPNQKRFNKLAQDFETIGNEPILTIITEGIKDYDDNLLGYCLLPILQKRLNKDKTLFFHILESIKPESPYSKNIGKGFGKLLPSLISKAAYKLSLSDQENQRIFENFKLIVESSIYPITLREGIIHSLFNKKQINTVKLLASLFKEKNIILIDAICHVIWYWLLRDLRGDKLNIEIEREIKNQIAPKLINFVSFFNKKCFKYSGILGALACINTETRKVLIMLLNLAEKDKEIARIISTLNENVDISFLKQIIIKVKVINSPLSINGLKSFIYKFPDLLKKLFLYNYKMEYLFIINITKGNVIYDSFIKDFSTISKDDDLKIRKYAMDIIQKFSLELKTSLYYTGTLKFRPNSPSISPDLNLSDKYLKNYHNSNLGKPKLSMTKNNSLKTSFSDLTPQASPISKGYVDGEEACSFAYPGDAIYRENLHRKMVSLSDHWHAGMFLGLNFTTVTNKLFLEGIHVSGAFYILEGGESHYRKAKVKYIKSKKLDFNDPSLNLQKAIKDLYESFKEDFGVGSFNVYTIDAIPMIILGVPDIDVETITIDYEGRRSPDDLSLHNRTLICNTAKSMLNNGIGWCYVDMLSYKGDYWNGEVEDIKEMRCDCLVEYSYEKNGIKVCEGNDVRFWNITIAGNDYADNHEDFHVGNYQKGELCPKIQAGNVGADSTFNQSNALSPKIDLNRFNVLSYSEQIPPKIHYGVDGDHFGKIFVRLIVRKDNSPFEFAVGDDLIINNRYTFNTSTGIINIKEMDKESKIFWCGRTGNGKDYWGQPGTYEFRLVVMDQGGNVSDTAFFTREMEWPESLFTPNNRCSDELLFPEFPILNIEDWINIGVRIIDVSQTSTLIAPRVDTGITRGVDRVIAPRVGIGITSGVDRVIAPRADTGITPGAINYRCDEFSLTFNWQCNPERPLPSYSITIDGTEYEDPTENFMKKYSHIQIENVQSQLIIPINIQVFSNVTETYSRCLKLLFDDYPFSRYVNISLKKPSIITIPYINIPSRDSDLLKTFVLNWDEESLEDIIKDAIPADVEEIEPDPNDPDAPKTLSDEDVTLNFDRRVIVVDFKLTREAGPNEVCYIHFQTDYKFGRVKNTIKCKIDSDTLLNPTIEITNGLSGTIQNLPIEDYQLIEGFTLNDYNENVTVSFIFNAEDEVGQECSKTLNFYAKSLLCIVKPVPICFRIDPEEWAHIKDSVYESIAKELIRDFINTSPSPDPDPITSSIINEIDMKFENFTMHLKDKFNQIVEQILTDETFIHTYNQNKLKEINELSAGLANMLSTHIDYNQAQSSLNSLNQFLKDKNVSTFVSFFSNKILSNTQIRQNYKPIIRDYINSLDPQSLKR